MPLKSRKYFDILTKTGYPPPPLAGFGIFPVVFLHVLLLYVLQYQIYHWKKNHFHLVPKFQVIKYSVMRKTRAKISKGLALFSYHWESLNFQDMSKRALASLYQITGLPLSDLPRNICTVAHIFQTHIYLGSYLPTSHLPRIKYTIKNSKLIIIFCFFFYCTACQHPVQKASTQRHGQPASTDIGESGISK